jgi:hypothetical protein
MVAQRKELAGKRKAEVFATSSRSVKSTGLPDYVPSPESAMTCGLVEALSLRVIVPDFAPAVCGENVTLMVHFAPGSTLAWQVEVMPNWPPTFTEEILSADLPVLVRVTVCGGLVVPCFCFLKGDLRSRREGSGPGVQQGISLVCVQVDNGDVWKMVAVEICNGDAPRKYAGWIQGSFLESSVGPARHETPDARLKHEPMERSGFIRIVAGEDACTVDGQGENLAIRGNLARRGAGKSEPLRSVPPRS